MDKLSSTKHRDKRTNIPTEELKAFVEEDEQKPKSVLYPRDPSLDPQLVWRGKDEQDSKDLEVPAVPVYIQEKVHPQALIEDLLAHAKDDPNENLSLFSDFNGIAFEDMVDFYHHEQNWTNRMVLGDSLLVMNSLAEKEGLKGKVQMIYIDPPYGIDFGSNWQVSTRKREVRDGRAEDVSRQPEQIKAFRDTWALGIHSYLAYLRDRLVVACELLAESGSVFVQIGDENLHLVRCLLDEVFGSGNFCSLITFRKKTMPLGSDFFEQVSDYLLWYAKDKQHVKTRPLMRDMSVEGDSIWSWVKLPDGQRRRMTAAEVNDHAKLPGGSRVYRLVSLLPAQYRPNQDFRFDYEGTTYDPPKRSCWKTDRKGMDLLSVTGRLQATGKTLQQILYHADYPSSRLTALWGDTGGASDKVYAVQTTTTAVQRCILSTTDPGDLVLDPTCGSGTTAYVAEQWGRRWITCDTSRVSLALARTRLMAARYPFYLLADSPEGERKEAEITGQVPPPHPTSGDIRKGFVYKRVPHITLKSISNNPEIDTIHAKYEECLRPLLSSLNMVLKKPWEEWQVPREAVASWAVEAKEAHAEWWRLRKERQKEIDASIARRADMELLYDRPYEDNKKVRVTGPFTVESLSPHRQLSVEEKAARAEGSSETLPGVKVQVKGPDHYGLMILENLKKAGVQNTIKQERLKFTRLEPYAGEWVHAAGEYTEAGEPKRVAVCIGPEHGTVGTELVQQAAVEAVKSIDADTGRRFDLLLVCGFAFDPGVYEEAKKFGKLTVLMSRMNPDLAMGDDLLKKTGAANLFMIFGEPDIDLRRIDDKVQVEIFGLDVYDPTTGEIRNHSTDDIACWFIDTDYNGQSFFVRHAYFTGADDPYEKLRKTLRAEIDEAAWSSINSTVSRPFSPSRYGKIAVKVINHYGDEVLKVYEVK